jgi:transposase-like protein
MARPGPRTVRRYSEEFKLTAVRLSDQPGIPVKTVAAALAIHPFMLSKWRSEARQGRLRGRARNAPRGPTRELARLEQLERDYALLKRGARPPKKSHPVLFRAKRDAFAFIATERAHVRVTSLCRRYGVSAAGFYAWRRRGESTHAGQDRLLATAITALFSAHEQRYGSPRIHRLLRQTGWRVSRRRVARLMRAAPLQNRPAAG